MTAFPPMSYFTSRRILLSRHVPLVRAMLKRPLSQILLISLIFLDTHTTALRFYGRFPVNSRILFIPFGMYYLNCNDN